MKKIFVLLCILICNIYAVAQPIITSFSPTSGAIGSTVTIHGSNFNSTLSNNIVFFGATKAIVTTASDTVLTVVVPTGSNYENIVVTNLTTGLSGYSAKPFNTTFNYGNSLDVCSFAWRVPFNTGTHPVSIAVSDLNLDGKPDVVVANGYSNTISVFKNISTSGAISFATKVDYVTETGPIEVKITDINGDGKPDVIVLNLGSGNGIVSIYKNTSSISTISLSSKVDLATVGYAKSISIGDIDRDGKPDVIETNSNGVSVFKNVSTINTISFNTALNFNYAYVTYDSSIGDLDGDGRIDIIFTDANTARFSVLRNTSIPGTITFASKVDFTLDGNGRNLQIMDLDGDSKLDLLVQKSTFPNCAIFKNSSTIANISFVVNGSISSGGKMSVGDLDGDGRADLANSDCGSALLITPNNSSYNNISMSFAFSLSQANGSDVSICDIDGDIWPDILITNETFNRLEVYRNQGYQPTPVVNNNGPLCAGNTLSLSTIAVPGAFYFWTGPNNYSSNLQNPTVSTSATTAMSGTYSLTVKLPSGCNSSVGSTTVNVDSIPANAGTISGPTNVCQGQNSYIYSVPPIANATSYIWTLPSGATGTSTTNIINVSFGTSATSGIISVKGHSTCGNGTTSTFSITVNPIPGNAGVISGLTNVCKGQTSVVYNVPIISNATTYLWTLPTGATGSSTTNTISVNYGSSAVSGVITVKGYNNCGFGTTSSLPINVNTTPDAAGTITGLSTVCQGQDSIYYNIPIINNATAYSWTIPSGATGGSTTNNIYVNFGLSAISGNITVKGTNNGCNGISSIKAITVHVMPTTPTIAINGSILHSDAPFGNQWYDQNGIIIGATNQDYTPTTDGDYYVIVSINGFSSEPSNSIHVSNAGIELIEGNKKYYIFPNPFSGELFIETVENNENLNFEIYNVIGEVIFKSNFVKRITVNTNNFASGVYLIKINNGKTFDLKKIIKK